MNKLEQLAPKNPYYYYPNRFNASRPWLKKLIKECNGLEIEAFTGGLYKPFYDMIYARIFGIDLSTNEDVEPAENRIIATREALLSESYLVFSRFGKQIFHFAPILSKLLSSTNADDVYLSDLSLNYDSFYMSFGKQKKLVLSDADGSISYVDGAYIWRMPDDSEEGIDFLSITLTSIKDGQSFNDYNFAPGTDLLFHSLLDFSSSSTVGEQIEQDFNQKRENYNTSRPEYIRSLAENNKVIFNPESENSKYWSSVSEYSLGNMPIYCEAIKLVINALCYLNSEKIDVTRKYPEGTPEKLMKKAESAQKAKERKRANSKLESLGYTRIHFCGEKIQYEYDESIGQEKELQPHWRRGHWRNQPYGKSLSERKLIWIKPTIVRADKGSPSGGHVYSVE